MKTELPNPRDDDDRRVLRNVAESGCHIVGVLADETGPAFIYSIGLFHNYDHPEILLFGLEQRLMQTLINNMRDEIRRGARFQQGCRYPQLITGFDCEFRTVDMSHYEEFFGYARWFYRGNEFPILQCVWPDKQGHFPGEPEFNPKLIQLQPTYKRVA